MRAIRVVAVLRGPGSKGVTSTAFAAPLGYKDIRLWLAAAEVQRVPMPIASLLHDRFLRLFAQGGDRLDWAAIGGLAARDADVVQGAAKMSSSL